MSHIKRAVQECYAAYYILASFGFPQSGISVGVVTVANGDPPGLCAVVKLKHIGLEFNMSLVNLSGIEAVIFDKEWNTFVRGKSSMSEEELDQLVQSSEVWSRKISLLAALHAKGLHTTIPINSVNCLDGSLN